MAFQFPLLTNTYLGAQALGAPAANPLFPSGGGGIAANVGGFPGGTVSGLLGPLGGVPEWYGSPAFAALPLWLQWLLRMRGGFGQGLLERPREIPGPVIPEYEPPGGGGDIDIFPGSVGFTTGGGGEGAVNIGEGGGGGSLGTSVYPI